MSNFIIFQRKKLIFTRAKINSKEQLVYMLVESYTFLNFQIFKRRFEFFDKLD